MLARSLLQRLSLERVSPLQRLSLGCVSPLYRCQCPLLGNKQKLLLSFEFNGADATPCSSRPEGWSSGGGCTHSWERVDMKCANSKLSVGFLGVLRITTSYYRDFICDLPYNKDLVSDNFL
ncbi:hypothetical protein OUZ56_024221 [Daphnia magna]|uniref:Uncharacterized protein n=1 Tax=Daphnia magna TaxID=35525 RepID=A0ABR0B0D4_9CRUS|nr:hypothetical protein OUZ56_024221 [Daphnia magna]